MPEGTEIITTEVVETEIPVLSEPEASTPEVTGEEPPPEPHVDEPPDPAALQAEIERLEAVRKEAEEKARYWRQQKAEARADYFKTGPRPEEKPPGPEVGPEPKLDDFENYEQYVDAKIAHEVNKARATWDREQADRQQQQSYQERIAGLQAKLNEGFEKYEDFEDVAFDQTVPITPVVIDALAESEMPADVAYYLGKNRAEAIRISRMTPIQVAREITRIEMEIKTTQANNPQPNKKISKAPPPIKPVGPSHTVEKDPDKMSQAEYEAWRQQHGAKPF